MSRAFIMLDETNLNQPTPELSINGHVFKMSERELQALIEEAQWAMGAISGIRATYWSTLGKYVEINRAK